LDLRQLLGERLELVLDAGALVLELPDLCAGLVEVSAERIGQTGFSISSVTAGTTNRAPFGMKWPSSRRMPRTVWMRAVRVESHPERRQ
jgi:hypothetical protein